MDKPEIKASIGLLGGTFDPVHFGHLRTGLDVVEALQLDQLRLIPCATPPHRAAPTATAQQRRMMLELAIKNHPKLVVDDCELQRGSPSYTVDTLLNLRQTYVDNPLFMLLGTDAFSQLHHWSRWQQILSLTHIVVMRRQGEDERLPEALADWYQQHIAQAQDRQLPAGKIWPVTVTPLGISATQIRTMLEHNQDVSYLLPNAVITLIEQLSLYPSK